MVDPKASWRPPVGKIRLGETRHVRVDSTVPTSELEREWEGARWVLVNTYRVRRERDTLAYTWRYAGSSLRRAWAAARRAFAWLASAAVVFVVVVVVVAVGAANSIIDAGEGGEQLRWSMTGRMCGDVAGRFACDDTFECRTNADEVEILLPETTLNDAGWHRDVGRRCGAPPAE